MSFWRLFLIMTAVSFLVLGFILGLWARKFEQLNFVPTLVITPLVFLGGSFYSIDMLPVGLADVSMFNPAMYLISGLPLGLFWCLRGPDSVIVFGRARVRHDVLRLHWYIFRTGYRLRN